MTRIKTERLVLRTFRQEDLEAYHATVYSDPDVTLYLPGGLPHPIEKVQEMLNFLLDHEAKHGFSIWVVEDKETGEFIGQAGIKYAPRTDKESPTDVELAYSLGKAYWNKGYGTEVAAASLRYGFEEAGLERIIALALEPNIPSQRVMQKVGMTYNGITNFYHDNELVFYEMKREDFGK